MRPLSCAFGPKSIEPAQLWSCALALAMLMLFIGSPVHAQNRAGSSTDSSAEEVQDALPARTDTLSVIGGGPFLIRPFLIQETIRLRVNGFEVPLSEYELDARNGLIRFPGVSPDSSLQIVATYQYVPLDLSPTYALWEQAGDSSLDESSQRPQRETAGVGVRESALRTRGQVTRGVLTGSNQSARIESGLRLEVEGEIAPGVKLEAELTDEDTPLVPEGVTRQFDQFDRIRIGFSSAQGRVDLGDFDALLQGTRYGRLQRKLQGAGLSTSRIDRPAPGLSSLRVSAGAAISRGQFHALDLDVKEGVQGPYRLLGAAGERFILVLPGTERVFLDGVQMQRGADEDYLMDYALGELTFTSRHLMGPDRRVRVEYEYTTNRFTRTLSFSEAELGFGGDPDSPWARLVVGGIREADGSAFVDEQGLTAQDSALVAQSADGAVQIDGAVGVVYDPEALFTHYTRTLEPGGEEVYVAFYGPASEEEAVYRVPFTFVGELAGDYRRIPSQSGGIAYEWVGENNGSYIAARTLPVPTRKMLGEARLHVYGIPGLHMQAGVAGSARDRNRLSADRASDVSDAAWDVSLRSDAVDLLFGLSAQLSGSFERRGAHFETFERIRSVEFVRDWGLPIAVADPFGAVLEGADESVAEMAVAIQSADSSELTAYFSTLDLGSQISSNRLGGSGRFTAGSSAVLTASIERSDAEGRLTEDFESSQRRAKARLARSDGVSGWLPWAEYEHNSWAFEGVAFESLSAAEQTRRLPFDAYRVGVARGWEAHRLAVSGAIRLEDAASVGNLLLGGSRIQTGKGAWTYEPSSRVRSSATLGMRRSAPRAAGGASDSERSLLIGWDGQIRNADAGTLQWSYAVRSEQTAAMQEVFIRTGQERGSYVWLDSNNDGQIQLDEYFPETTPGEGEYARTLFPSDSLESVTTAEARLTYAYLPTADVPVWRKLRWQTSIDVRETSRTESKTDLYLLRPSSMRQSGETINGRLRAMQRVGLFPLRRDRELEMRLLRSASLAELASGSERMTRLETGLSGLEALSEDLDLTFDARWTSEEAGSERFASRQFEIDRWEARPGAVLLRGDVRVQTELMLGEAKEAVTNAQVRTVRAPLDVYWTRGSASWRTGGEWSDSQISGGTPIGLQLYELTEGRGAGQSWMWHLHVDVRLTEVMTATLRYDGRRPSTGETIHTGRFHLTARF